LPVLPNRFFGTDNTGAIALVTGTDAPAGSLTDANIASDAAIALSKLATGALPAAITVASANIVDGTIVNADISDTAAITPTKLSQPFTQTAAVPTTSGALIVFTAIPSWVKRITVILNQVQNSGIDGGGNSGIIVQLGTSSGFKISGYIATGTAITGNNLCGVSSFTAGFNAGTGVLSTSSRSGCIFLQTVGSNFLDSERHSNKRIHCRRDFARRRQPIRNP
jgi:hypothetical protein